MADVLVFVSQALPGSPDGGWTRQFADELRQRGVDVVEEWSIRDEASRETAEQGLRESDVVVSVVDHDGTESPNLFFELGVAIAGKKHFVAIVPRDLDLDRLPVPIRTDGYLVRHSPAETAAALIARTAK